MTHQFSLRLATPDDYPHIQAMSDATQEHERAILGYPLLPAVQISAAYWAECVERVERFSGLILVAESQGEIVGCVLGYTDHDDDILVDAAFNRYALLADLFVAENWRGHGIAQALIAKFAERMRTRGCDWLRVCSKSRNSAAMAAYIKAGFDPYETVFVKRL